MSGAVGAAGLAGLAAWLLAARAWGMDGPAAALSAVFACGVPMVVWSLAVDKVHRNSTSGLDWSRPPCPMRETLDISLAKLAGLWATWALIAIFYAVGRWYWDGQYLFAMRVLGWATPFLLVASIPYVLWLDRRLGNPRDGAWAFGQFLLGQPHDPALIAEHARAWAVKAFFTAFMISIVPGNWAEVIRWQVDALASDPVALARFLIALMFLVDVSFATVGYVLTLKPLDAHIRSANPYAAGWTAALICYPPFILMNPGGPLDYHPATADWTHWLAGHPLLLAATGGILVALTGVYAWATVAFGLRFSNLTHRGIITHGPYRWTKHPAYLSKNLFWWIATMPFLATSGNLTDMVRNSAVLAAVSGVYYWRARTEERHLSADPAYVAYAEWMNRNGLLTKFIRAVMPAQAGIPPDHPLAPSLSHGGTPASAGVTDRDQRAV